MLEKLFGGKKHEQHPFSTPARLDAFLQTLPHDDVSFINAINEWLDEIPKLVGELGLEVCLYATLRFDQSAKQVVASLLRDYLNAEGDRYLSKSIEYQLGTHTDRLCAVYSLLPGGSGVVVPHMIGGMPPPLNPKLVKSVALDYFHAIALSFRLAKFRYRRPGAISWQRAHGMLRRFFSPTVVAGATTATGNGNGDGEILREYLKIAYLNLVPINNISPQQIEFVARMVSGAQDLTCLLEPDENTTHIIDITADVGPIAYNADLWPTDGSVLLHLSSSSLQFIVQKYRDALANNIHLPRDFADLPISRSQVAGVLSALNTYWTNEPPNRGSDRIVAFEAMRGAVGFRQALNLVDISEKVLRTDPVKNPHSDLLNRLWQLEERLDRKKMEDWVQVDGSEDGIGVSVPTILSRHVAGSLVSMRYAEEPGWHMGVVRRVGVDQDGSPRLGLKTFPGVPKSVQIHLKADTAAPSEVDRAIEGIMFDANADQLLIPAGVYVEGRKVSIVHHATSRDVSMIRLIETGPDFELVEVSDL